MIVEAFFNIFFFLPNLIISWLPGINIGIPDGVLDGLSDLFKGLGYFLPIGGLLPILIVSLTLDSFKIIMAIFVRLKSFIPFMGD